MAKSIDYSKIKAMASSILECIGEDEEGTNPNLPEQKQDFNDGGQDTPKALMSWDKGDPEEGEKISDSEDATDESDESKKKNRMSAMASMISRKFNS